MYTVGQVAKALGVSDSTIRQWARHFEEYVSEGANPPKGRTRQYNEEDITVLQTIAVLRDQLVGYEEIDERLSEGERLEPPPGAQPGLERPQQPEEGQTIHAALVTDSFSQALKAYDSQISSLQSRLEEKTDQLVDAERRAAAAETEARLLREQLEKRAGARDPEPEEASSWRHRLGKFIAGGK